MRRAIKPFGIDLNPPSRRITDTDMPAIDGKGITKKQILRPWIVVCTFNGQFKIRTGIRYGLEKMHRAYRHQ